MFCEAVWWGNFFGRLIKKEHKTCSGVFKTFVFISLEIYSGKIN
jgi:hypothetical protein